MTTPSPNTRIAAIRVSLPETVRTADETEYMLRTSNPGLRLPTGLISRMTGVRRVHVRHPDQQASDLAADAARAALADVTGPVDHLIFASASQDLIDPATSHILADKLGLDLPVFDVKNACNSLVNGMQTAYGLIATGQASRVLVASGETPTSAVRWQLSSKQQFLRSFPGYTMSDGEQRSYSRRRMPRASRACTSRRSRGTGASAHCPRAARCFRGIPRRPTST